MTITEKELIEFRPLIIDELKRTGIFVVHALKGYEYHEKRIIELFGKNDLKFEFVTGGDPIHFKKEIIEKYFIADIDSALSEGVLSCTLNHILAYEKMVKNNNKFAIVFENDPFFLGNFKKKLVRMFDEITKLEKGFIISLENSTLRFPSYWQTKKNSFLYRAKAGRMAGAYLIDLEGATKILNDLKHNKCHIVIDWWHNSLIDRGVIKMYWAHPALVEQGSHNGRLNSTISSKPSNMSRRMKWLAQKYYKLYIRRLFKEKCVITTAHIT
jgi:glycosyl transferase family 25